jgi:hypothetical protein
MDLASRIQQLEDLVRDAKSMPLSSSALVNREEVLDLIMQIKEVMPEEIRQARWVVKDREELLAKARRDSEHLVSEAEQEQLQMASREAIVQRAIAESDRIRQEANEEARRLRLDAEDYVDAKLAQLESALNRILEDMISSNDSLARTIDQVQAGREKLRGTPPTTNTEIGPDVAFPDVGPSEGVEA